MSVSQELYDELLRELEEAEKFLVKAKGRRIYASFGGRFFIEVTPEEAREILEKVKARLAASKSKND